MLIAGGAPALQFWSRGSTLFMQAKRLHHE